MTQSRVSFRPLLNQPGAVHFLCVDTPQSALALKQVGANAAGIGGFALAAVQGQSDEGHMTLDDMIERGAPILRAAPQTTFLVDGETGFADPAGTIRRWAEFSNVGMVFIEDQKTGDRRCGHMSGHVIIPQEEMCANIKSACSAKVDDEPMIMARTDARSAEGSLDAALKRGRAYLSAGADALFIEAPQSTAELETIAREFKGEVLLANLIEGGKTPEVSARYLEELGFKLIVRPVAITLAYTKLVTEMVGEFYSTGELSGCYERYGKPVFAEFKKFIGAKS